MNIAENREDSSPQSTSNSTIEAIMNERYRRDFDEDENGVERDEWSERRGWSDRNQRNFSRDESREAGYGSGRSPGQRGGYGQGSRYEQGGRHEDPFSQRGQGGYSGRLGGYGQSGDGQGSSGQASH